MTTTTVPITITCPDWCELTAERHAADLWDNGGECFHHMPALVVEDPTGIGAPLEAPQICPPVELRLVTTATPDGREVQPPIVYIDKAGGPMAIRAGEHSVDQALALADALRDMVQQYRAAGGTA